MDVVFLLAALTVGLAVVIWLVRTGYELISRIADRRQQGSAPAALTDAPAVRLAADCTGGTFSRRCGVVWDGSQERPRIRVRTGLRRLHGQCVTSDDEYVCEAERGWPLGRRRVTLRRRSDGTVVGEAAQPRRWGRRIALRGGVELTQGGVDYGLRPRRRGGATIRANGEPVGSFVPRSGSLRCEISLPSVLGDEAGLFVVAAAVACDYTTAKTSRRRKGEPMGPFGEGARIAGAVGFAGAGTAAARSGGGGGEITDALGRDRTRRT